MNCKLLAIFIFLLGFSMQTIAQNKGEPSLPELVEKIDQLERKISFLRLAQDNTETEVSKLKKAIRDNGLALILFAIFCAWWAKSTGRSSLLWFFLGLLFHIFTAIALLIKTERGT